MGALHMMHPTVVKLVSLFDDETIGQPLKGLSLNQKSGFCFLFLWF